MKSEADWQGELRKDSPLLYMDLNDYMNGQAPLYQLKRHLIAEKDDLKAALLAKKMSDYFYFKLMQGVGKEVA